MKRFEAIVVGCSAGGVGALIDFLPRFPTGFHAPIVVVIHLSAQGGASVVSAFQGRSLLPLKEADEKERPVPGVVYFAPPGYHLLIERDGSFSLSVDPAVNFVRPAIDVLFETAADAFGPRLAGVLLTGSGEDGARGLARIRDKGGLTIVQNPGEAEVAAMPRAALARGAAVLIAPLADIPGILLDDILLDKMLLDDKPSGRTGCAHDG